MGADFKKKAYDDIKLSRNIIINVLLDKFALRVLNHLAYNREISGPVVASYLLRLFEYYTLSDNGKFLNPAILRKCLLDFVLHIYKTRSTINNLLRLPCQISTSLTIFDNYCYSGSRLSNFYLFMYKRVINIYP